MRALMRLIRQTDGERRFVLAMLSMAVIGAIIGLAATLQLGSGVQFQQGLAPYDIWVVSSSAVGAMLGLWVMRHRMGHAGLSGLLQALVGGVGISFFGPLIAGSLALPLYGTMFGPFTLVTILFQAPGLAVLWLATLGMAHHLMRGWTAERDSIFTAKAART